MRTNHVTETAPGQSIASVEAFLRKKNELFSDFFECELSNHFAFRYLTWMITWMGGIVINESMRTLSVVLMVIGAIAGAKALVEYIKNMKEE